MTAFAFPHHGATKCSPFALTLSLRQGVTFGISNTVKPVLWALYFGKAHVGAIMGIEKFTVIAGTATGPLLYGLARDKTGSFDFIISVSVACPWPRLLRVDLPNPRTYLRCCCPSA